MAEKRKLLAEIDKVFRKVEEGVEMFDETMTKMQEANSENQREKFQDDLKKEIKKLQRQRDQIKTWQNSAEVKDKDKLLDFRKIIEGKMEQFKDVERENKTKPHSKQGLIAEEKLDPKEKEKTDTIEWLQSSIGRLNEQCDFFESNLETLNSSAQSKKKKGRDDKEMLKKSRQSGEWKLRLERHKFHIQKLELVMRLVNNDSLECDDVNNLRDEIGDYIDRCQEEDFVENEFIYEDLNLGDTVEITQQLGNVTNIGTLEDPEETSSHPLSSGNTSPSSQSKDPETKESASKSRQGSEEKENRGRSASRSTPPTPLKLTSQLSLESALSTPPQDARNPPPQTFSYNSVAARNRSASVSKQVTTATILASAVPKPSPEQQNQAATLVSSTVGWAVSEVDSASVSATLTVTAPEQQPQRRISVSPTSADAGSPNVDVSLPNHSTPESGTESTSSVASLMSSQAESLSQTDRSAVSGLSELLAAASGAHQPAQEPTVNGMPSENPLERSVLPLKSIAQQAVGNAEILASLRGVAVPREIENGMISPFSALLNQAVSAASRSQEDQEAKIPPSMGASPLGRYPPVPQSGIVQQGLESAVNRAPLPMDSEKLRYYLQRTPCQTPAYYPQVPPPLSDTLEYFSRLSPETLFFVFYYMEGTKAQYLAAKALKKQSWRFHKKYLMWFQRHEEPKIITDEYEQGTYIYFDFEKWAQRKKEGFTFEYRYLEDRELS